VVRGQTEEVQALLDTGFDGFVIVPPDLIADREPPDAQLQYALADGSIVTASVYRGTVQVGSLGPFRVIVTLLGDEPIIGRQLIERFTITLDHGARVIVEP
jgi:clan AA aspartic protease